jgi:hypothetical protein
MEESHGQTLSFRADFSVWVNRNNRRVHRRSYWSRRVAPQKAASAGAGTST